MIRRVAPFVFAIVVAGCEPLPDPALISMAPRVQAQTQTEVAFVTALFNEVQPTSISEGREYCGLIGVDARGDFVATTARRGGASSCLPPETAGPGVTVLASYHTHARYTPDYWTEVPSFDDMRTDIEDGTDGYIATPGGRLWYVDARAKVARQICGARCLVSDPTYPEGVSDVQQTYTLDELRAF